MGRPRARELREYDANTRHLIAFARIVVAFIGSMPFWLPLARGALGPVGDALDVLFVLVCHRLPERTLSLAGEAMPVCSRCAGIFGGLALGVLIARPRLSLARSRLALGGAGLFMLADVVAQDAGLHPVWHSTRLATGGLLGYLAAAALVTAIARERALTHPVHHEP